MEQIPQKNFTEKKDKTTLLEEAVSEISSSHNRKMREFFKIDGFLGPDGRIDMKKYMERGSIGRASFERDAAYNKKREIDFSRGDQPAEKEMGQEEMIKMWKEKSQKNPGNQMELLAIVMFHKFFSEELMVVRSSTFDDYHNGIDMVLVNRRTGAVICAFDDVIGYPGTEHLDRKNETIQEIVGRDGATLKYGFRIKRGPRGPEIAEEEIRHLPIFCLQVSFHEFQDIFDLIVSTPSGKPAEKEIKIMKNILAQIEGQCNTLLGLGPISQVRENIRSSMATIAQMKKTVGEYE